MGKCKLPIISGGGGDVVNGVLEEYYAATEDISANTFVEFALDKANPVTLANDDVYILKCVDLGSNKVMVAYQKYDSSNTYGYTYGCIINFDGKKITVGTSVTLLTAAKQLGGLVKASSTVCYAVFQNYIVKCTISSSSISVTSYSTSVSYYITDVCLLSTNQILVACTSGYVIRSCAYFYIMTVSSSEVTVSTAFSIITATSSTSRTVGVYAYMALLSSTSLAVCYVDSGSSSPAFKLRRYSISGTTFTQEYAVQASSSITSATTTDGAVSKLSSSAIVMSDKKRTYFKVIDVGESSATLGDDYSIDSASNAMPVVFSSSKIGFLCDGLKLVIYNISGTTATLAQSIEDDSAGTTPEDILYLSNGYTLAFSTDSNVTYAQHLAYENKLVAKKATTQIDGLTKTKCTTTSKGKVWVLS